MTLDNFGKVKQLHKCIGTFQHALNEEIDKVVLGNQYQEMVDESPGDLSARYWLMQFLEPLNRKELKSVVDGFLVQLLNEDQAKKLVKFLLVRFPNYYKEEIQRTQPEEESTGDDNSVLAV